MLTITQTAERAIIETARRAFAAQGHSLTGATERGFRVVAIERDSQTRWQLLGTNGAKFTNQGVLAKDIPFGNRGGRSSYIAALEKYAQLRFGLSGKEALSAAFAIARKHKQEGMPTRASQKFSSTGRRTNWIPDAMRDALPLVLPEVRNQVAALIQQSFSKIEGR